MAQGGPNRAAHSACLPGADGEGVQPRHVAIIMDGNGRWASARGLPRLAGHKAGLEAVRQIVRHALLRKVGVLSLYAFSTENWSRPAGEVSDLMGLLRYFIRSDLAVLAAQGVCIRIIGERDGLGGDLLALLEEAEQTTRQKTAMTLLIAFNYGGRAEIARAARRLAGEVARGERKPESIDTQVLSQYLDTADLPDPDLLIRTSGEQRISNFLLWQCAYAEMHFSPVLWPDFDAAAFDLALQDFSQRQRRFGGLG